MNKFHITCFILLLNSWLYVTAEDKPILTFGCLSDIHNQNSMINTDINNIRLRTSFLTTLDSMKKEPVDLLILGGDYTSDVTINETQWKKVRELMATATRATFSDTANYKPVIYIAGNHDYEVANFDALPKPWNAADYYTFPMKSDIGELPESECYYEDANNGSSPKTKLLVAYHYIIKGFDFVVLNPGNNFFTSAWDYQNSTKSIQWVSNKLTEIFAKDTSKTVFFLHHLPLPESKGVTTGKTLIDNVTSTRNLKKILLKYPNLIYLYGHDHSTRTSFIETNTSQRVTEYDSEGNILTNTEAQPNENDTATIEGLSVYVKNTYEGSSSYPYMCGGNSFSYLAASSTPTKFALANSTTPGYFYLRLKSTGYYLTCSGTFSLGSTPHDLQLYRVTKTSTTASPWVTAVRINCKVADLDLSQQYIMVGKSTKQYVVSNENKNGVLGSSSSISYPNDSTFTYTSSTGWYNGPNADNGIIWQFIPAITNDSEQEETEKPQAAVPSFISAFMGSMRYNSLNSNSSPGTNDSPIIQALMVYVYSDSIVLRMKNYGQTGYLSGSAITTTIADPLIPYISHRKVVGASEYTIIPTIPNSKTKCYFVDEQLILTDVEINTRILISDLTGRCIAKDRATSTVYEMNIPHLTSGLYLVHLQSKDTKTTFKVWRNK